MKKILNSAVIFCLFSCLISCGISKEVRTASTNLVSKQKASLTAHHTFHQVTLTSLTEMLNAELARSERTYEESIKSYNEAMLDELKIIYEDGSLSAAEKKVKEEAARQKILGFKKKAEDNRKTRDQALKEAQTKLIEASRLLLEGEQAKANAIVKLDAYLQAKRPSERLLEQIDIDLDDYSDYISQANQAIKQAEPFIDKLNK